jgi:hypothetical protein
LVRPRGLAMRVDVRSGPGEGLDPAVNRQRSTAQRDKMLADQDLVEQFPLLAARSGEPGSRRNERVHVAAAGSVALVETIAGRIDQARRGKGLSHAVGHDIALIVPAAGLCSVRETIAEEEGAGLTPPGRRPGGNPMSTEGKEGGAIPPRYPLLGHHKSS